MSVKKTYVLDTNVLLHDADSIYKFEDNTVALPVEVLSELDRKKTAPGQVGANARRVNRELRALFENRELSEVLEGGADHPSALVAALEHGGTLKVVINEYLVKHHFTSEDFERLHATLLNIDEPDHRIIASCLYLRGTCQCPVILVTKDACMALKAKALGLEVQDYRNDRVESDEVEDDYASVQLSMPARKEFAQEGRLRLDSLTNGDLYMNEYVILTTPDGWKEPARFVGENTFVALPLYREYSSAEPGARKGLQLPKGMRVVPKNFEQWVFLDALLNPDIKLVTCFGRAGTGKTFLSIAAALTQVLSDHTLYKKLYISRPVVQVGKDLGFLPGDKDEKLAPYIQPYFDNLEVLFSPRNGREDDHANYDGNMKKQHKKSPAERAKVFGGAHVVGGPSSRKPYQWLMDSGFVDIEAMTYIRGRSISRSFFIVDEAQNMTPHEAKTVITRMAEGSKLVLIGDLDQVDTPYLDSRSNGLIHTHERMKGHAISAHVRLIQGVRSELSELASHCM